MLQRVLLALVAAHAVLAQEDPRKLLEEGIEKLQAGQHEESIAVFKRLEALAPETPLAPYNIACAYSLMGSKKEALAYLRKAVSLGFLDLEHMKADSDLDAVRGEAEYAEIVREAEGKIAERDRELRTRASEAVRKALEKEEPLFPFSFEVKDIEGERLALGDLRGKVVIVDVWGTWCPPCIAEVPHLIALAKEYGKKGLVVVGLAYERGAPEDAPGKVRAFARKAGITYRCAVIDREFVDGIPEFRGFPTLLILDREGKVRFRHTGYSPYPVLAGWAEAFLESAAPPKQRWF